MSNNNFRVKLLKYSVTEAIYETFGANVFSRTAINLLLPWEIEKSDLFDFMS